MNKTWKRSQPRNQLEAFAQEGEKEQKPTGEKDV